MAKITATQKIETITPWIGKQVRITYDDNLTHTANCDGVPQFVRAVEGRLIGISARFGTYQRSGGWIRDLVIFNKTDGLVTVSLAKTLTVTSA